MAGVAASITSEYTIPVGLRSSDAFSSCSDSVLDVPDSVLDSSGKDAVTKTPFFNSC